MSARGLVRKSATCLKLSLLVFMFVAFAVTMPVCVVYAAPLTVDVSPSSAPVGGTVTISGVDATAFGEVRFYLDDVVYFASTVANGTGGYSVDIALPAIPADTYPIMALDVASGDTASTMFSVEPRILLTPDEGSYSDAVSVRGDGFSALSFITITFDGVDVTPVPQPETDDFGSFWAVIYVPSMPNGTYAVLADDGTFDATAFFDVVPKLMLVRSSGAPLSLVYGIGYGFGASVNYTLTFDGIDVTPREFINVTMSDGSLIAVFFIPDLADGVYSVEAVDGYGNAASAPFVVPGPILSLSPDRAFESTIVTARGMGFQPSAPIVLYLEDITMTSLIDLMWMSPSLIVDERGWFEYSFVVPVTAPGVYSVSAFMMTGAPPAEPVWLASAPLTIVDGSPLDLAVTVGSLHFRGELAEFYVEISFGGKPVDATVISAKLYWNGTLKQDLTSSVGHVAIGLYRIPYSVPSDASVGAYNLVVEASYVTSLVESFGASFGSFLVSGGFSDQNAWLIDVQGKIGTIVVPDLGVIKANLTAINARLVSMDGREATIESDIGVLKTDADTISAKVTSIDGNVATVTSDLGTVKSQVTASEPPVDIATLVLSLVAAIGGMLSVMMIRRLKSPAPKPTVSALPATPPPASMTVETSETTEALAAPEPPEAPETTETPTNPNPSESSENEDSPPA